MAITKLVIRVQYVSLRVVVALNFQHVQQLQTEHAKVVLQEQPTKIQRHILFPIVKLVQKHADLVKK